MDRLRDLLTAKSWKEADMETSKLLIGSLDDFSSEDLSAIDQLWVDHSNGLFGFSIQKAIYQRINDRYLEIGRGYRPSPDMKKPSTYMLWKDPWKSNDREPWIEKEPWEEFVCQVGWYKDGWVYEDCTFDLTAPKGHLPVLGRLDDWYDDLGRARWRGLSCGFTSWYSDMSGWHPTYISDSNHSNFLSLMSRLTACDRIVA